ncbi:11517_t:CDS:2 [Racocetra persica]|uniref:11517_t:CDS:1 n=1 Tax=Racocetra persica TaxID=160502 RepID=A0ACA9L0K1_9GLOM|nr:11517_t:CDS:2 [Racocetra persica]
MSFPKEFSEETKRLVAVWRDIVLDKHKDDNDEIFCSDPLLIIKYNQPGLVSRNITENHVAQIILGTPGYTPIQFPNVRHPPQSNSVFAFNGMQILEDAITRLFDNYHNSVLGRRHPTVGRVYVVEFHRANTFEALERFHIFD